jgi:HK97 gp10 family phage protein
MPWQSNPFEKIRKIRELNEVIEKNLDGAAEAGAGELLGHVKAGAPKRTRKLVNTLRLKPGESTPNIGEHQAVTDAFYWRFSEYGTSEMAAAPFVRPAIDTHGGDVGQAMEKHMTRQTRRLTG